MAKKPPQTLPEYTRTIRPEDVRLVTKLPNAKDVPYHASQPHKPCRISKRKEGCWVSTEEIGGKRLTKTGWEKDDSLEVKQEKCIERGGFFTLPMNKQNRAVKLELEMLSPSQAAYMKTQPGANLRVCFADGKPGRLVPIETPEAAVEVQKAFAACVGDDATKRDACAVRVAGEQSALGELRRNRKAKHTARRAKRKSRNARRRRR